MLNYGMCIRDIIYYYETICIVIIPLALKLTNLLLICIRRQNKTTKVYFISYISPIIYN